MKIIDKLIGRNEQFVGHREIDGKRAVTSVIKVPGGDSFRVVRDDVLKAGLTRPFKRAA